MAMAKQQPEAQYRVTMIVDAALVETVAKKLGGVEVEQVQKIEPPKPVEWMLTDENPDPESTYRNKVWTSTDGRHVVWTRPYEEDGVQCGDEYVTRDDLQNNIGTFKTLGEAQAAQPETHTDEELLSLADNLATLIMTSGENIDVDRWDKAANEYAAARRLKIDWGATRDDDEKTKAQSEYVVTIRVKGSTLPAVEKKAKTAWGDRVRKIEHVRRHSSNADLLNDAQEHVEQAVEIIAELQGAMEERRDNTPENFQGNKTYSAVEQAVEDLGSLRDEVEGVISAFDNIEFPGW